jgi:hypothetical protein
MVTRCWRLNVAWLALAVLLAGCTKSPPPGGPQGPMPPQPPGGHTPGVPDGVQGSVKFDGAPVMAGLIELHDATGKAGTTTIGYDGTFLITGVPEGEYTVAVKLRDWPVTDQPLPAPPPMGPPQGPPQGRPNGPPDGPPNGPPMGGPPREFKRPPPPLPALSKELKAKYDRIDEKYEDPAKSGLTCKVSKGLMQLDLSLQAAGAAPEKKAP